ncbi:ribonuclease H-like domain-containing protein [Tanacetum coccineum]
MYPPPHPLQPQISHSSIPPSQQYQSHMDHQTSSVPQISYHSPQASTQPMTEFPQVDSCLVVPVVTVQQVQGRQGQSYSGTSYKGNATSSGGNNISEEERVVKCYNCQGEEHIARQCTHPKRPRNVAWFKEKAMLAEAQEAGQILDEEQLTEDLDAYDSDCDDVSNAKTVMMANLSDCANMGTIRLRKDRRVLGVIDGLPRTVYHVIYLGGKALIEREIGLRVADSHTGNHPEDDFMPLKTIRRSHGAIRKRIPFDLEGEDFEPKRRDEEDLSFLPKESSPSFSIGSPSMSVNIEPPRADEEPVLQPVEVTTDSRVSPKPEFFVVHLGSVAARIKDRKCKTRGGSSRPPVKRKLASGSSNSRATRDKTSTSKDDVPFLTVFDDKEGLSDIPELKYATACYLNISAITPPVWKNHLDNHMDVELLDLHDRCYARQVVVDNAVNRRSRELLAVIEKLRGECDVIKERGEPGKKSLRVFEPNEVDDVKRDRMEVVSKVVPYAAMELVHSDDLGSLVGRLVSSAIFYGRCKALEQVAGMKEPFDLSKVKGYRPSYKKEHDQASNDLATATFPWLSKFVADPSAPVEVLLSKKPLSIQRPAPSKTQAFVASSHKATPSSILASNLMSPPADASVVKP